VLKERKAIRREHNLSDRHIVIGWFGSIYHGKGLLELIRACASLKPQENPVVLLAAGNIGDAGYFQRCLEEANSLNAVEFRYLGVLANIAEVLPAVDLVSVPSIVEEAFPNVALEAMAYGKCMVAYRSGGLQEIVSDGVTGILVGRGDTASLGAMIQELVHDRVKRETMGKKARARAVKQYRYDLFKKKVQNLIKKMTERD
jgi:glycosyltransferase involved in cell wall biosynthesis